MMFRFLLPISALLVLANPAFSCPQGGFPGGQPPMNGQWNGQNGQSGQPNGQSPQGAFPGGQPPMNGQWNGQSGQPPMNGQWQPPQGAFPGGQPPMNGQAAGQWQPPNNSFPTGPQAPANSQFSNGAANQPVAEESVLFYYGGW